MQFFSNGFLSSLILAPSNFKSLCLRAEVLLKLSHYQSSLADIENALKTRCTSPKVSYILIKYSKHSLMCIFINRHIIWGLWRSAAWADWRRPSTMAFWPFAWTGTQISAIRKYFNMISPRWVLIIPLIFINEQSKQLNKNSKKLHIEFKLNENSQF